MCLVSCLACTKAAEEPNRQISALEYCQFSTQVCVNFSTEVLADRTLETPISISQNCRHGSMEKARRLGGHQGKKIGTALAGMKGGKKCDFKSKALNSQRGGHPIMRLLQVLRQLVKIV
jgi:hypothetical protein